MAIAEVWVKKANGKMIFCSKEIGDILSRKGGRIMRDKPPIDVTAWNREIAEKERAERNANEN